jgi:dihydrofolate synthase/folylpolyglutamate synthase
MPIPNPSPSCDADRRPGDRRQEALAFLFGRINYEQLVAVPYSRREFKLDRMRDLLARLDHPETAMPIVHVAGTKGKGSTAAMVAGVLTAAGYRTGLFTSPHLDQVEERIAVDGQPCSGNELVELIEQLRPVVETMDRQAAAAAPEDEIGPTYFELTTAMALLCFRRRRADAAVLEVGLGGRLDSTNVCTPQVSIITSISFDHTRQLGNTLAAIAAEKAGIIKPGVPVVSGVTRDEPRETIRAICRDRGCPLAELGVDFRFDYRPPRHLEEAATLGTLDYEAPDGPVRQGLALGMIGRHQAANAAVALAALDRLRDAGWDVPEAAIRRGLAEVRVPARVEVLARRPTVVLDTAHNVASIRAMVEVVEESFSPGRRRLVLACTQEKDLGGMIAELIGHFDDVILTRYTSNPRSVPPEELAALMRAAAGQVSTICGSPAEAWDYIRRSAQPTDLVCIAGSFFLAAEMRREIAGHPLSQPAEAAE